ncbi:MAG TPA: NUDIX hydrolase [Acidimicrobiia bacterium]|nr:NUDIX hydrolase [Acidimicrobiia bacterium]
MAVSVDVAVFSHVDEVPHVVLIRRGNEPFQGAWALPGGFVELEEDLPLAAARELEEETGIVVDPATLTQVGAYGSPGRDPRMRVVDVLYWVSVPEPPRPVGGSDAAHSQLIPVSEALSSQFELAFDHPLVLRDAVRAAGL